MENTFGWQSEGKKNLPKSEKEFQTIRWRGWKDTLSLSSNSHQSGFISLGYRKFGSLNVSKSLGISDFLFCFSTNLLEITYRKN